MLSSLNLSDLSQSRAEETDDNNDIELLNDKIAVCQSKLEEFSKDSQTRHQKYEMELNELAQEIQDAKHTRDEALTKQQLSQTIKYKLLKEKNEDEKRRYEIHLKKLILQNEQLEKTQREMLSIDEQSRSLDFHRQEVYERSQRYESDVLNRSTALNKTLSQKMKKYNLLQKLKRLEQEVNELQSTRREIESEFKLRRSELINKYEVRQADNRMMMTKLQQDMRDREDEYGLHLGVTKMRIEKEKQKSESEMKMTAIECDSLQKLHQTISKRGCQQLSILNQDIERMKRLLETAKQEEVKMNEQNLQQSKKLLSLTKNTFSIRKSASSMADELTKTQVDNEKTFSHVKQMTTPTKKSTYTTTTTTPTKKQSIFT